MGNTRVRARLSRALSILTLAVALAAGPVFVAPAAPAAAAPAVSPVEHDRAMTGETPSPRVEVRDDLAPTPEHLAIGGLSAALLLAVIGGFVLDVRRRRPEELPQD